MKTETMNLWTTVPLMCEEIPKITLYCPDKKTSDAAVVIFSGGGYRSRALHEGEGYARFLAKNGIYSFVVDYRVNPHLFPCQLLDARRAVKFVRYYSEKYGIDKNKIAVMGSSAGGHLAALVSTYFDDIDCDVEQDEIERESFIPDAQILCYPVIRLLGKEIAHLGSGTNLLGEKHAACGEDLQPDSLVSEKTPQAFIWHTAEDSGVSVLNSYEYAKSLKKHGISAEVHIFPDGPHGMGLCDKELFTHLDEKMLAHTSQWVELLIKWLKYIGF